MTDLNRLDDFFITSDTWFGRKNILEIAKRSKFKSVEEMNSKLIENWNKKVGKNDIVFHLGNFAWDPLTAKQVAPLLNGQIYFILGNDDKPVLHIHQEYDHINVLDNQIIILPHNDVVLSHYPLRMWAGQDTGTMHIHGHAIYSLPTDLINENRVNVCSDYWNYAPIKLSTIKEFRNEEN